MSTLPVWARKPKHRENVIATDKGWVVESTGEVLRSVKNLPAQLAALVEESVQNINTLLEDIPSSDKESISQDSQSAVDKALDMLDDGDKKEDEPKVPEGPENMTVKEHKENPEASEDDNKSEQEEEPAQEEKPQKRRGRPRKTKSKEEEKEAE